MLRRPFREAMLLRRWNQSRTLLLSRHASSLPASNNREMHYVLSNQRKCRRNERFALSAVGYRAEGSVRYFQNESAYHSAADETLEAIQDAVEEALEDHGVPEFEVTFASGVLTLVFPPHGTWVINKQTPNQQLWWSSPISGPRRYEFEDGEWVYTRDETHSRTLRQALASEVQEIYQIDLDL